MHFSSEMYVSILHLAPTNACTDITHSVVVSYLRVLVVRSIISHAVAQKHRFVFTAGWIRCSSLMVMILLPFEG
jgi:hypothetical protein